MDGWIEDSIAIVDAYKASIAIRIMSDTRDRRKTETKIKGVVVIHIGSLPYSVGIHS
jgi:hypothetical protein